MIVLAVAIVREGAADDAARAATGVARDRAARQMFGVSILYLFALFAALAIDDRLGAPGFGLW